MRTLLAITLGLSLVACADSTPNLEGTYDFAGPADQVHPNAGQWQWMGRLTIFHDGGSSFSGSHTLSMANGVVSTPVNGDLTHTAFESDGSVRFRMSEGSIRADGAFHASRITGDWVWVLPDSTSYSGTFTAIRRDP